MRKGTKGLLVLSMAISMVLTSVSGVYAAPKKPHEKPLPPHEKEHSVIEIHVKHEVPKPHKKANITFIDLSDSHWAYIAVSDLYDRGIIVGYADNSFKPNVEVTRSQFATMLSKTLSLESDTKTETFEDVPKKRWDFEAVEAAKSYLTGYQKDNGDMFFYGERSAVREDMAVALVKALDLEVVSNDNKLEDVFDDYEKISENLRDYVYTAYKEGIMIGSNGQFNPQDSLTRAEAAALLEKVIEKTEKVVIDDTNDEDKVVVDEDSDEDSDESSDATLYSLKVDNWLVDDFDENDNYYSVKVDADDDIPVVTAVANDSDARLTVTQATYLPGTARVLVEAEDGTNNLYKVHFVVD